MTTTSLARQIHKTQDRGRSFGVRGVYGCRGGYYLLHTRASDANLERLDLGDDDGT
jgi:hypothetical protein